MTEESASNEETTAVVPEEPRAVQPQSRGRRRFAVAVIKNAQGPLERASQAASGAKGTLKQIGKAVDPREVAGGFAGLTAGEAAGGAVGGVAGASVAGPPGAVVGAQVGAFTAGMLGLKLGVEAVQDIKEAAEDRKQAAASESSEPPSGHRSRLLSTKVKDRVGEIVGLTSGATVGVVVAGPIGGLVGAVVGETIGGRVKGGQGKSSNEDTPPEQLEEAADPAASAELTDSSDLAEDTELAEPTQSTDSDEPGSITGWLENFGKNATGEAATVLVTGSVGALFGQTGMNVGHGIGRVISRRVEWHKLGKPQPDAQPAVVQLPAGEESPPDGDAAPDSDQALLASPEDGQHEDNL
ncbi:MAG: hypothetical protein H6649_13680 [Caldilineae bacterium]|nr:hypothetical protein [Anaerolineae bacterium]MCB9155089.1 hypothetical protein [Caldilineae bacterium]